MSDPARAGESVAEAGPGGGAGDPRLAAAEGLLRANGIPHARVSAAGHEGEIIAVTAPAGSAPRLAALAAELRSLGFRYVALDLEGCAESG